MATNTSKTLTKTGEQTMEPLEDETDSVSVSSTSKSRSEIGSGFDGDGDGNRVETDGHSRAQIVVPTNATDSETAALVACLSAYLRDRRASVTDSETKDTADGWVLAGRYDCRSRNDLPRSVDRGEEWKMSGRTGWR